MHSSSYVRKTLIIDSKQDLRSSDASIFITQQSVNHRVINKKSPENKNNSFKREQVRY